jgi:hypothetical protein
MTAGRNVITLNKDWCTPRKYVDAIRDFFGGEISLDPCSSKFSIVSANAEYRLPDKDGLKESWDHPTIYVNPPYGMDRERRTTIRAWLKRCADANHQYQSEVLALVPVAVNTRHWKEYVFGRANSICFLADTRLKFIINGDDLNKGAPMACAMVYWGTDGERFYDVFSRFGAVVSITNLSEKRWSSPDVASAPKKRQRGTKRIGARKDAIQIAPISKDTSLSRSS